MSDWTKGDSDGGVKPMAGVGGRASGPPGIAQTLDYVDQVTETLIDQVARLESILQPFTKRPEEVSEDRELESPSDGLSVVNNRMMDHAHVLERLRWRITLLSASIDT